ncbi:MAG: WecB/TagA/CpsF family glycosyltransferase [Deltaproteobacteria bacterium]|nr:WecB/TagA/CpsF family glycosyltransferase [Deltaproteobacteria bacterium]
MPSTVNRDKDSVGFMDVDIAIVDEKQLFDRIILFVRQEKPRKVLYVNAHCMVISRKDKVYRNILNNAHLVYADGISLVWGARLLGHYLPGRLTAADFMPRFFSLFAEAGLRVYMLGARPGVAETAAQRLREDNPGLEIVGTQHGYFKERESERIIEGINRADPHILMVGMGVPYQEKWIDQHYDELNASVIWGVGALFDFLSGRLARGPQWLLASGFEWLCRLVAEPRRLWQRYLVGNLLFVWYVLRWKLENKKS